MNPIVNLNELGDYTTNDDGPFAESYAPVSDKVPAERLSYSVTILQPGKKVCPFHNHHIAEELFIILEGEGTLRFGDKTYPVKKDDVIACPPGGREVAHQLINTSDKALKFFCLSTNDDHDIVEYPDSNKTLSFVRGKDGDRKFRHISKIDDAVDYYLDES